MYNPDIKISVDSLSSQERVNKVSSEIGPEHSVWIQKKLMYFMIPEDLKSLIVKSNGENITNEGEVFFLWNEYFSERFRNYWDLENISDEAKARLERAMLDSETEDVLTTDDYKVIVESFSEKDKGEFLEKVRAILV